MGEGRVAPGGKRLLVSASAASLALLLLPAWALSTWPSRAALPTRRIAIARAAPPRVSLRPPCASSRSPPRTAMARSTPRTRYGPRSSWARASEDEVAVTLAVAASDGSCVVRGAGASAYPDPIPDPTPTPSNNPFEPDPSDPPPEIAYEDAGEMFRVSNDACCFGRHVLTLWTLSDRDVDDWLSSRAAAEDDPKCGRAADADVLFLFPSDAADAAMTFGSGRHAWVRNPAGGGRSRQTGADKAADAAKRTLPVAADAFATAAREPTFQSRWPAPRRRRRGRARSSSPSRTPPPSAPPGMGTRALPGTRVVLPGTRTLTRSGGGSSATSSAASRFLSRRPCAPSRRSRWSPRRCSTRRAAPRAFPRAAERFGGTTPSARGSSPPPRRRTWWTGTGTWTATRPRATPEARRRHISSSTSRLARRARCGFLTKKGRRRKRTPSSSPGGAASSFTTRRRATRATGVSKKKKLSPTKTTRGGARSDGVDIKN